MTVERYRRKPRVATTADDQYAAPYQPGQPLDDLRAVAAMADGEVAEVTFPSGRTVLLACWMDVPDHYPAELRSEVVEAGNWLAYSAGSDHLYETDQGDLRHFYDPVEPEPEPGPEPGPEHKRRHG